MKVTEHMCDALGSNNETYKLLTCGASLMSDAIEQFSSYINDSGGNWLTLTCLSINAIEVDA